MRPQSYARATMLRPASKLFRAIQHDAGLHGKMFVCQSNCDDNAKDCSCPKTLTVKPTTPKSKTLKATQILTESERYLQPRLSTDTLKPLRHRIKHRDLLRPQSCHLGFRTSGCRAVGVVLGFGGGGGGQTVNPKPLPLTLNPKP